MATATITKTTLSGSLTTLTIINSIRDILIGLGFTLFDSYLASGFEYRVMAFSMSAASKGTVYLWVGCNISNGILNYAIYESWNTTNKTGVGNSTQTISTSTSTTALNIYAINHPEFKGLAIEQGTTQGVLGFFRPKNAPPAWWNENNFLYAFMPRYNTTSANSKIGSVTTPFGSNIDHDYLQFSKLQDGNPLNNDARSIIPLCILSPGVAGILLTFDDLIICASNTMRMMDTITISPNEIYTYFWGNALNSGLAIRTT